MRIACLYLDENCPEDSGIRITYGLCSICILQCRQQPFTHTAYAK